MEISYPELRYIIYEITIIIKPLATLPGCHPQMPQIAFVSPIDRIVSAIDRKPKCHRYKFSHR